MSRGKPKYLQIANEVIKSIEAGQYADGDYLPSQKDLMETYDTSLTTVRKCIEYMVEAGWVRTEKGKGLFARNPAGNVRQSSRANLRSIGLACVGWFHGAELFYQTLLDGAVPAIKKAGVDFHMADFRDDVQLLPRFTAFLEGISGLILFGEFDRRILEILKSSSIKTVIMGTLLSEDDILYEFNRVSYDAEQAGYLAVQALVDRGRRRLFLGCDDQSDRDREVRRGFIRACEDFGIKDTEMHTLENHEDELRVAELLSRPEAAGGVIIKGDAQASCIAQELIRKGFAIPTDRDIVSIGGVSRQFLSGPNLPRVEFDGRRWSEEVVRLLLSDSRVVVHKLLPVNFVEGEKF